MHKWVDWAHKKLHVQYFNGEFHSLVIGDFCARIIPPWDLHVPFTCIIGSPAILFLAIMLHNVTLHKWCQEKNTCTGNTAKIEIFGVFNSFTVKKVNFFTINVKFKVILSSKSGGGDICTGHPPTQNSGGGGIPPPPHPPWDLRQCYRTFMDRLAAASDAY